VFERLYGKAPPLAAAKDSKKPVGKTSFLLIAFPDVTMTLDALSTALSPLLLKHPDGALLLLGLPGLPNTTWPTSQPLSAPNQARAVHALLRHLISSDVLDKQRYMNPSVPILWAGVGAGVSSMLYYATHYLIGNNNNNRNSFFGSFEDEIKESNDLEDQMYFNSLSSSSPSQQQQQQSGSSSFLHRSGMMSSVSSGNASHNKDESWLRSLREQTVVFTSLNGFAFVDSTVKRATSTFQKVLIQGSVEQQ
jgi:hypothetical protein